jgi:hypothetical protein
MKIESCIVLIVITILIIISLVIIQNKKQQSDSYVYSHPINSRLFPQNFYTTPYYYEDTGSWPPGMYTRLKYDYPSFSSGSGWTYELRPGVYYGDWQYGTWVRHNDGKYFINNDDDRRNDFYGSQS